MKLFEKAKNLSKEIRRIKEDNQETRLLMGAILAKTCTSAKSLREAEFKVFSQFGDDGIIQFLVNNLPITVDKFVEFGVENYEESNTRFLLMNNNWRGLIIDGSQTHITNIKKSSIFWRYDLTAINSFITTDNINEILRDNNYSGRIGILSVDIDGNDYWIWKAITVTDPDIVISEYNSLLGAERSISVPYKPDFSRSTAHYSYLYFGASLPALCDLADTKGYAFVGCNQAGNNAFFVKKDIVGNLPVLTAKEGFIEARFREMRDHQGQLTFSSEEHRRKMIVGLPVVNVRTGLIETI